MSTEAKLDNLYLAHRGSIPVELQGIGYWFQPKVEGKAHGPKIFAPLPLDFDALVYALEILRGQPVDPAEPIYPCKVVGFAFPNFIHVRYDSHLDLPTFAELAPLLIGGGFQPCTDFKRDGRDIYLQIKTRDECSASIDMLSDGRYGLTEDSDKTSGFAKFCIGTAEPATPQPAPRAATRPTGNNKIIHEALQLIAPHGQIHIEKLYAAATKKMQPRLDSKGHDRRRDNIRRAINWLAEHQFLFYHGPNAEQVSLTSVIHAE